MVELGRAVLHTVSQPIVVLVRIFLSVVSSEESKTSYSVELMAVYLEAAIPS
jgi:hypothetical protein